jgi:UDP-glucose 4-epimerase
VGGPDGCGTMLTEKVALVIGACGFIGSNLVANLPEFKITALKADLKMDSKFDVSTPTFLDNYKNQKIDYIFHFGSACSVLQYNKDPVYCVENTLSGFRNVILLAKQKGAKLVYPSSGNVYGRLNPPHRENMWPKPTNLYGVAKLEAENMVKLSGIDAVGLRIFTGYGFGEEAKGELASVVCHFLLGMMKGQSPVIWGDGKQERDCVFITDVVNAAIGAAMNNVPDILNIGSGYTITYNEIIENINEVLGTNIEPKYIEKPQNFVDKAVADITLMRKYLNVKPLSLKQGLEKYKLYLEKRNNI